MSPTYTREALSVLSAKVETALDPLIPDGVEVVVVLAAKADSGELRFVFGGNQSPQERQRLLRVLFSRVDA